MRRRGFKSKFNLNLGHPGNKKNNVVSVFCVRVFFIKIFRNAEQVGYRGYACAMVRSGWHTGMEFCLYLEYG